MTRRGCRLSSPTDGISLVPAITRGEPLPDRTLLLSSGPQQSASGNQLPMFDGVRTDKYSWWIYEDGFEEMYDLENDPYQLESVANDPEYLKIKLELIGEWNRLKGCEGSGCSRSADDQLTPSMVIAGIRDGRKVKVVGATAGLAGVQVTAWTRSPGSRRYTEGAKPRTVASDGTFTWQRTSGKRMYVYFRAADGLRSNRAVIPAK